MMQGAGEVLGLCEEEQFLVECSGSLLTTNTSSIVITAHTEPPTSFTRANRKEEKFINCKM